MNRARRGWLGPVFASERLALSRRWQGYASRSLFVLALLAALGSVWISARDVADPGLADRLAGSGRLFFQISAILQLALILVVAPAVTAGAICLDKARGTLAHVMVTDLDDAEVVLGKLAARLVPVLNLLACGLPVLALGGLLGGIDPIALAGAFAIASGVAVLGGSLALTLSVWVSKAHEVMTVAFAAWAAWLLPQPLAQIAAGVGIGRAPHWLELTNPFWLTMARYAHPGETSIAEPALFLLACLAISGALAARAVAKLRPVYLDQLGRRPGTIPVPRAIAWWRREVRWSRGPALDANPVLWREWHRDRPTRWSQVVWAIFAAVSALGSLGIAAWLRFFGGRLTGFGPEISPLFNAIQGTFGLLLVAASAASALAEERVRGSLDVLLATPISTRSIVFGKWWGTLRRALPLAICPCLIAYASLPPVPEPQQVVMAYAVPLLVIAQGAAVASLGLALATWIPRAGRAAGWTVAALITSVVAWPVAARLTYSMDWVDDAPTALLVERVLFYGSPFMNLAESTSMIGRTTGRLGYTPEMVAVIAWSILYGLIAGGLYLATLLSFDRCMGRASEHPRRPEGPEGEHRRIGPGRLRVEGAARSHGEAGGPPPICDISG